MGSRHARIADNISVGGVQPSAASRKPLARQFDMKSMVTANQKGGVGKTATIVHLAFDFVERGLKVAVVDIDPQANASYTLQEFTSDYPASHLFRGLDQTIPLPTPSDAPEPVLIAADALLADIERMTLDEACAAFQGGLAALSAQGFDVCLIDTAPTLGNGLAAALYAAQFVLSPIELEAYSIQGIDKMLTTISNIREFNEDLQFLGMVPSKVDARNPRHALHLAELNAAYPQLMIPAPVGLRSSIADALASGIPVWRIRKTAARKAAQEVRALANYVHDKMEITQ